MTGSLELADLMIEYSAARAYSLDLVSGLDETDVAWRPSENSSAMAWHLGHQAAVNHYMVRNLTAAEPPLNEEFDAVFDSATPESARGDLPSLAAIIAYRGAVGDSTQRVIGVIDAGDVGAPSQLRRIANAMLRAIINHEYQHAKWIGEVRAGMTDRAAPRPSSQNLIEVDGYFMVTPD